MKKLIERYKKKQRALSFLLLLVIINNTFFPTAALALTGGPSQPEVQSFEPIGTSEMVDMFSGDFNYNLPLMDVDGYPINMSYHSGITTDQEASWVGLGWNINPGVINRSMRGVPDDFNGETIVKENNVKDNITVGINAGFGAAIAGFEGLGLNVGFGINYNNYVGVGVEQSVGLSFNLSKSGKGPLSSSLGLRSSNTDGLSVSPSVSFSSKANKKAKGDQMGGSIGIGTSFNSRGGLKALSISGGVSYNIKVNTKRAKQYDVGGGSSSIDFGVETFVPHVNIPMRNSSIMFQAQFGATLFTIDGTLNASGYFSKSKIEQKVQSLPSYGYFYEHNGVDLDNVMLDFNREKDGGEFSVNTPGLPVTNHTYDIFNVNGQGVSGAYRLHRSDIGYVFDNSSGSTNDSYSLGVEVASANTAQVGIDISVTDVNTTSGKWTSDNALANKVKFKNSGANKDYEPTYFKMAGEKVVDPERGSSMYNNYKTNTPLRAEIVKSTSDEFDIQATSNLTEAFTNNSSVAPSNQITKRVPRAQEITYLKVKDQAFMLQPANLSPNVQPGTGGHDDQFAEVSVIQPDGKRYVYGKALLNLVQKEVSFNASGNVIDCGRGYVNYAVGDNSGANGNGSDNYYSSTTIPQYSHSFLLTAVLSPDYIDIDGIKGPSKGDFGDYTLFEYQQNSSPNSALYSGSASVNTDAYNWRTPVGLNTANYNEGLKTKDLDNQGNYVYGQKEVVYLKYVKTKNYVAVFELNDPTIETRLDGAGVNGENGGTSTALNNQSRFLKTITLYSRPDFEARVANSSYKPFPLKQVHFEYDYKLCPGTENSTSGKLTLNKVYFTYGNSNKAKFSPYEFAYANLNYDGTSPGGSAPPPTFNPSFNPKAYNKWGYYKPQSSSTCSYNDDVTNTEYPYVEQDFTTAGMGTNIDGTTKIKEDNNVAAWSLTKIKLPSGGEIKLSYEADDYGYVQDKQAMEMFKMAGVMTYADFQTYSGSGSPLSETNMEGTNLASPDYGRTKGVVIKLKNLNRYNTSLPFNTTNTVTASNDFKTLYLKDLINTDASIYFREYVKVNGASNNGYEFVSGYANIDKIFAYSNNLVNAYGYAFIPLGTDEINLGSNLSAQPQANPLVLAALKFARIHTSREAFSVAGEPSASLSPKSLILALADASFINTIIQTFEGPEKYLYQVRNLGHHIIPGKSWIRLYNPYFDKLGGGSRVKSILISDNWDTMDGAETPSQYGQIFDYTTTQIVNNVPIKISSGVTTYEPMIGADDNPFRKPNFSGSKSAPLAPDTRYYLEEPYGESLFPSPSVGYSNVKMRSVALDASGNIINGGTSGTGPTANNHATGYTLHQFYTAKDYPVIVNRTDMDVQEAKSSLSGQLLKLDVKHYLTASQGFVVELNDMHGKPKANWVYAEGQTAPLSGVQYFYRDNFINPPTGVRSNGNKLANDNIPILDKDGYYRDIKTDVGIEYDMVADFREEQTITTTAGGQINLYVFYVALPFLIPPIWPTYSKEDTRLRTASFTKVINRYGILDQTIAYQDGATIKTNNLMWDGETGEVLLTKTQNEFKDDIYNLNIPAHIGFQGMSSAYENNLMEGPIGTSASSIESFLVSGDEVIVSLNGSAGTYANSIVKGYVFKPITGPVEIYVGPDKTNQAPNVVTGSNVKVIRSGRRNMQNTAIGAISFHRFNPLMNGYGTIYDGQQFPFGSFITSPLSTDYRILNASAVLFTDESKIDCDCYALPTNPNPYYWGLKGNWKPKESYLFLTERNQTSVSPTTDPNYTGSTRADGTYKTFTPFWTTSGMTPYGGILAPNSSGWTWTNSVSVFSVEGQELENRDALNRYSAATFGYNNKLPLSVSNNSLYKEVGFDGFEDYSFDQCLNPRFKFKDAAGVKAIPTNAKAHTGRYSIKVNANGQKVELKKQLSPCGTSGPSGT